MPFLHELVPVDQSGEDKDASWQGNLLALERMIRTAIQEHEENSTIDKTKQLAAMSDLRHEVAQIPRQTAKLKMQTDEMQEQLDTGLKQILNRLNQQGPAR